jgi:hypothetical protein
MTVPAWLPSTAQVAALIPTRCQNPDGDFTAETVPSAHQVRDAIAYVAAEMGAVVGAVPEALYDTAAACCATGAAATVEMAFTSFESRDTTSRYDALLVRYETMRAGLAEAVARIAAGEELGQPYEPGKARWAFPDVRPTGTPDWRF